MYSTHRPHRLRRAGIAALALCATLLAPGAQAQLIDWYWNPWSGEDFSNPAYWLTPDGTPATHRPDSSIRGVVIVSRAMLLDDVTLGSLLVTETNFSMLGISQTVALSLMNSVDRPSLVVANGSSAVVQRMSLFSTGTAQLAAASDLYAQDLTWAHDGTLAIGATPSPDTLAKFRLAGYASTLAPALDRLDILLGSASAGELRVDSGAWLDATTVRVGAVSPGVQWSAFQVRNAQAVVRHTLDVGHLAKGFVKVEGASGGTGLLDADRVNVGFAGGEASWMQVGDYGTARFSQLSVGTQAASQGLVTVDGAGTLQVAGSLALGGEGSGNLVSHGTLAANAVSISGFAPGARGDLITHGATQFGRVSMQARSSWITQASTVVDGSVTVAEYGGSDVLLKVAGGGELHVKRDLWVGDYHHFETQPIDQRIVVEPGARLVVDGGISLYATAALSGGGTVVTPSLRVYDGTVAPGMSPGHLTIDGDLSFAGGELVIEIGGLAPGTEHDVLEVLGTLTLDQWGNGTTLVLKAVGGFTPQAGQGFDFLRAAQVDGSFTSLVDETGLGLTLADLQFSGGHIGINLAAAVPEPHAALLMLLGLIALRLRHGRAVRSSAAPPSGYIARHEDPRSRRRPARWTSWSRRWG